MESENNKSMVLNVNDVLNDTQSSVVLTQSTKGVGWKIKVYDNNPTKALEKAQELFENCKQKYHILSD